MRKKITIVGRGTVGCLAAAHFKRWTECDIDWVYDPSIPTTAVGEGTTATTPRNLYNTLGWIWRDIQEMGGTPKTGIYKQNWGTHKDQFTHSFQAGTCGMHFNALEFQDKAFKQIASSSRVTLVEDRVTDFDNLDSDYVMVCAGSPKNKEELVEHKEIPVNAAYVTQCYWDVPRFTDTLTIARPYGWVFGIPLKSRCSIGYLYNKDINTLAEVKEDVANVFEQFKLEPSEVTNNLFFDNYSRKVNYTDRVAYTGNASFFLEPLEATSINLSQDNLLRAFDVWFEGSPSEIANAGFTREVNDIKSVISLHYMAGSKFDTPFWLSAKEKAEKYLRGLFVNQDLFSYNLLRSLDGKMIDRSQYAYQPHGFEMGTWPHISYKLNVEGLGIEKALRDLA